jgi:cell wall-associated NlpC family hydrolase
VQLARSRRRWPRIWTAAVLVAVIGASGAAAVYFVRQGAESDVATPRAVTIDGAPDPAANANLTYERVDGPPRTLVRNGAGEVVATLSDTARTAVLAGPSRIFTEPQNTPAVINSTSWVRLLPQPWRAGAEKEVWFRAWLDKALQDRTTDVLAAALEYTHGAPPTQDGKGVRFKGDASFGPVATSGAGRLERSDFYDYLGIKWDFPDVGSSEPEKERYGAVDCSGYIRLVYGYRFGFPLRGSNEPGPGLPRRAYAIAEVGPGVQLIKNQAQRAADYDLLQPGDLVFFEAEDGEDQIDHSGIYLGTDEDGRHRFVSSREKANGPTLGDLGGTSLLDDGGFYSKGFRAARRI